MLGLPFSIVRTVLPALLLLCCAHYHALGEQPRCLRMLEERPIDTPIGNLRNWAAAELGALQAASSSSSSSSSSSASSSFSFSFSPPSRYFRIDNRSGDIIVKAQVDRESLVSSTIGETGAHCQQVEAIREQSAFTTSAESTKNCDFSLQAIVTHGGQYRVIPIKVCIDDVNDNSPSWGVQTIHVSIPEHRGTQYTPLPPATDADRGEAGRVGYRLGSNSPNFRVNVTGNEVYLVSTELDREANAFFTLRLNATDYGSPARTAVVQLNVTVVDVNDNAPQFARKHYEVNVTESASEVGRTLFVFHANDPDSSSSGNMHYSLAEDHSGLSRLFSLNEQTGQLVLISALDYERKNAHRLKVNAFDGVHYADAVLTVNVHDVNDHAPQISLVPVPSGPAAVDNDAKVIRIQENTAQDQAIAFINALDLDGGNNSLLNCSTHDAFGFALRQFSANRASKQTSYSLMLLSTLDREVNDQQEIIITCQDAGTPSKSSTSTLTIIITDVNDNAPQFSAPVYSVSIPENNEAGRFVADISASDADIDENAQLAYAIVQNPNTPHANSIAIDAQTGRVYANQQFNRESVHKVGVLVQAVDHGVPPRSTTTYLEINVEDTNDNAPEFTPTNVYEFTVAENEQYGIVIGEVRAIDNDATERNSQVSYELLRGTVSERYPMQKAVAWFAINERGQLVVNGSIDYEEARSVTLRVEARDNGHPPRSSEATVIIRILDVNDNKPVWQFPNSVNKTVNCSYYEPVGTLITYVSAIDLDSGQNGQVLYSLKAENSASAWFALNDLTGGLYIAKELSQVNTYHHIVLEARDRGNPSHLEPAVLGIYISDMRARSAVRVDQETPFFAIFNDQRQVIVVFGLVVVTALLALVLVMTISYMKLRKQRKVPLRRRKTNLQTGCADSMDDNLNYERVSSHNGRTSLDAVLCDTHSPTAYSTQTVAKTDVDSQDDLHPIYASHRRPTTLPTQPHCTLSARSYRYAQAPMVHSMSGSTVFTSSPGRKHSGARGRDQQQFTDASASGTASAANSPTKRPYSNGVQHLEEARDTLLRYNDEESTSALYGTLTTDVFVKTAAKSVSSVTNKIITFRSVPSTPTVTSASSMDVQFFDPTRPVASGYLTVQPSSASSGRNRKRSRAINNNNSRPAARKQSVKMERIYAAEPTPAKSISDRTLSLNSPCFNESSKLSRQHDLEAIRGIDRPPFVTTITPNQLESSAIDPEANANQSLQIHRVGELHSPEGVQAYEADSFKPHHLIGKPCSSYV